MRKINYNGSSKVIKRLCETVNALIDQGSGSAVTVTPIRTEGENIADINVDGINYHIYATDASGGDSSPLYYDADGHLCIDYDLIKRGEATA